MRSNSHLETEIRHSRFLSKMCLTASKQMTFYWNVRVTVRIERQWYHDSIFYTRRGKPGGRSSVITFIGKVAKDFSFDKDLSSGIFSRVSFLWTGLDFGLLNKVEAKVTKLEFLKQTCVFAKRVADNTCTAMEVTPTKMSALSRFTGNIANFSFLLLYRVGTQ